MAPNVAQFQARSAHRPFRGVSLDNPRVCPGTGLGVYLRGGLYLIPGEKQNEGKEDTDPVRTRMTTEMSRIPNLELHIAMSPAGDTAAAWHKTLMLLAAESAGVEHYGHCATRAARTHSSGACLLCFCCEATTSLRARRRAADQPSTERAIPTTRSSRLVMESVLVLVSMVITGGDV